MPLSQSVLEVLGQVNVSLDNLTKAKESKSASEAAVAAAQADDQSKGEALSNASESLKNDTKDLYAILANETGVNPS